MKKLLLLTLLAMSLARDVFGQGGNFVFLSPAGTVWDTFSVPKRAPANMNVSFLWGTGTPLVDSIAVSTPTNGPSPWGNSAVDILNDPNFTIARNDDTGQLVVGTTLSTGGIAYNSGNTFRVSGTSIDGGSVTVFMIAWPNAYPNPAVAAASGSVMGWSAPFLYNYANTFSAPAATLGGAAIAAGVSPSFGVGVPEPNVIALFGIATTTLFSLRHRRQN